MRGWLDLPLRLLHADGFGVCLRDSATARRQEAREQKLAEGSKGSRNHSSVAYDTETLEYHPSPAGQKQKYEDDLLRYKVFQYVNMIPHKSVVCLRASVSSIEGWLRPKQVGL